MLYTSLSGEAETELEHAPIESINSDKGIDFILETLRTPMEQKLVFQKRKFLSEYENIQRQQAEGLRAFSNRYRRAERNLRAVGVEVGQMYDNDSRGNRLLERARLSPQDQRLILVGSRYSLAFEDISESMHMQYPEFRAPPPVCGRDGQPIPRKGDGKGKPGSSSAASSSASHGHGPQGFPGKGGPRRVYKTDQVDEAALEEIPEEQSQDERDEQDDDPADALDNDNLPDDEPDEGADPITEALDVLTVTAKKLSSLKLGRKFSGGPRDGKGQRDGRERQRQGRGGPKAGHTLRRLRGARPLERRPRVPYDDLLPAALFFFVFGNPWRHRREQGSAISPGLLCQGGDGPARQRAVWQDVSGERGFRCSGPQHA